MFISINYFLNFLLILIKLQVIIYLKAVIVLKFSLLSNKLDRNRKDRNDNTTL